MKRLTVLFSLFTFIAGAAPAQDPPSTTGRVESKGANPESKNGSKVVSVEWEATPDAIQYDLEFTPTSGSPLVFNTSESHWSGPMTPGVYKMRIRSKDSQGRVSDWSPADEFRVSLSDVILTSPAQHAVLQGSDSDQAPVNFTWQKVMGADSYLLEVLKESGAVVFSVTTKDNSYRAKLDTAFSYKWRVQARAQGLDASSFADDQFELWGPKIAAPKIQRPQSIFVRELSWSASPYADHYSYMILRQNPQTHEWERLDGNLDYKDHHLVIPASLPGGHYRLSLKAKGAMHPSSDRVDMDFGMREGDRSEAAEEAAAMREAIDRVNGFYAIMSYFITVMNYNGVNHDLNSSSSFNGIGGTGRFGLGYFGKASRWGFLGIADISGINLTGNGNYLFGSLEANGVYRTHFDSRNEVRQQIGFYYKQLPEFDSTNGATGSGALKTPPPDVQYIGPHYGVEYWHSVDRKIGFETNFHLYPTLYGIQTPTSGQVDPGISYQFGLLGSYRFDKDVTGLVGYAYRFDQIRYQSSGSGPTPGTVNSDSIGGHYLNVMLEWAL